MCIYFKRKNKIKMNVKHSVFLTLNILNLSFAANILILEEVPSPSHHLWFKSVTSSLAEKGHNITIVSGDEDTSTENVHYIYMDKVYETFYNSSENDAEEINFFELGSHNIVSQIIEGTKFSITICSGFLRSPGWEQLNNYPDDFKFDLIIHDYLLGGCLLNFMQKFQNAPLLSMTAFNDNFVFTSILKSAVLPAINPYPFLQTFPTTFVERTFNVFLHLMDKIVYNWYVSPKITEMVRASNKFPSTISVSELSQKNVLFLTNYEPAVDGPHLPQLPPNVIGVGGLQIREPKPLPLKIQTIMDSSIDGLILFSLGTNVQSEQLGEPMISNILDVFRQFPTYTFLWKIDLKNFLVSLPANTYVMNWIPQNDILAHNKTKLFITHAGLLSTQEAIWYGVPMLGIPIFADQFVNILRSVDKGIAEVLYLKDLTKESLHNKLQSMLTNTKFRENIQLTSTAFRDQKETPLERAVWWIEWVIRNPNAKHFKGAGQNLNFLQIESADVFAVLTVAVLIIVWIVLWISYKTLQYIYLKKLSTNKKKAKEE